LSENEKLIATAVGTHSRVPFVEREQFTSKRVADCHLSCAAQKILIRKDGTVNKIDVLVPKRGDDLMQEALGT
jgi:hypothetical protein